MHCDENFGYVEEGDHFTLVEYLQKNILTATRADIPAEFNKKPVTAIGDKAFKDAVYLECVTFPDSVTSINFEAFSGCSALREIVWANGLSHIGYGAFEWCTALERLELPEGLRDIDMYAFGKCLSLKEVTLPHSLGALEFYVFRDCSALEKVVFLNKDILIENYAFSGCESLPAETLMYQLILSCDINKPFAWYDDILSYDFDFDDETALREDVFVLAMEHDSFSHVDKQSLFSMLLREELMECYFPYMKKNGWIYRDEQIKGLAKALCFYLGGKVIHMLEEVEWFAEKELFSRLYDSLLDAALETENTELTAWILEYKNRHFGFDPIDPEDKYEL